MRSLPQVDLTLERLGHLCARLEHAEQRFKQMTDECSHALEALVSVDRRHATTLATLNDRLGDWCDIERKLLEESASRIERFERGVEREWTALRRLHEEPIEHMRNEADKLRIACLDAARLVHERLDAAERNQLLQTMNLERRLAEWSDRTVQAARASTTAPTADGTEMESPFRAEFGEHGSASPANPWPLDGVAQLHQEMRTRAAPPRPRYGPSSQGSDETRDDVPPEGVSTRADAADTEAAAVSLLLQSRSRKRRLRAVWIAWAALAALLVIVGGGGGIYVNQMQRQMRDLASAAQEAVRRVQASNVAPSTPSALESVQRAGTIADILAAPDLLRYVLTGVDTGQGAYGQVLWSRTRGMALTAVGLKALSGGVYRAWVSDNSRTAPAGNLSFDGAATARLIVPGPLTLPRPAAIVVTLERSGSEDRPVGAPYLVRLPPK